MIIWTTVWVLTVQTGQVSPSNQVYQLTYREQKTCLAEIKKHSPDRSYKARCDFQQIPLVK